MQFQLRTLFILTAICCVYLGLLSVPPFITLPLFCAICWTMPAYWITGVIYARGPRRAFYIGGLSAGAVPFLVQVFTSFMFAIDGPWRWQRWWDRYDLPEIWLVNIATSAMLFAPLIVAFLGAWIAYFLCLNLQSTNAAQEQSIPKD